MLGPIIRAEVSDTFKVSFKKHGFKRSLYASTWTSLQEAQRRGGNRRAIAGQEFDGNSVPPGQNWSQVDTTVHNFAVIRS